MVSDIGLPDGNGLELLGELRKKWPIQGIALTGFGMEEDLKVSRDAGFLEHLTKPVNFQKLEMAIQRAASAPRESGHRGGTERRTDRLKARGCRP